ncbi:MAG: NAD(P)/FAD-dependent oxidoreductase [Nitrospirales bacterium]|nr:NAD(P)/FAD-dependent oxidoreductase [Nitrospirales bacterium]
MNSMYVDVAIIGGGLAGNFLARQLRRTLPHLTIGLFEKNKDTSFKVGESTVEIASNYMARRLGLSTYLTERQLPKNGLRFFFDRPDRQKSFTEMSEIGGVEFPYHPSFQLDRSRLESDLLAMNQEDGVEVHLGSQVKDLELGAKTIRRERHRLSIQGDSHSWTATCRWLIDASGRHSLLARKNQLRLQESQHHIAAVWGRCTGFADLDSWGPEKFRARIQFTTRRLSTIHFCYSGYWIWIIPLGDNLTSVGVVGERSVFWNDTIRKMGGFLDFLKQHRAVWSLMESAKWLDIGSYHQLAYNTKQYFSEDGWGLTGEAASFTDPFYSPGSDFIALENDFLTHLIQREEQGDSPDHIRDLVSLLNRYMHYRFQANMRLYYGAYSSLGSYELLKLKWQLDFPLYYHLWFSHYLQDFHLDEGFLREQVEEQNNVLNALDNFSHLFRKVEQGLRRQQCYDRFNSGNFTNALEGIRWVKEVGLPQTPRQTLTRLGSIFNRTRQQALEILGYPNSDASMPISYFISPQQLV